MTYEEAMTLVDSGRIISRESEWVMRVAGFAWGNWICRQRQWTEADSERGDQRSLAGNWDVPPIESSGSFCRTLNTLCESVFFPTVEGWEADVPDEMREATDYIDVTDRFHNGTPRGYVEAQQQRAEG